jgi:peptide-methionine (S)-S-oxide reductase
MRSVWKQGWLIGWYAGAQWLVGFNVHAQPLPDPGVQKIRLITTSRQSLAAFALGGFRCGEAAFAAIPGVDSVVCGYAGGITPFPTRPEIDFGQTRHAETVLVYYKTQQISYEDLTRIFFAAQETTALSHRDSTWAGLYRSILFYRSRSEKKLAKAIRKSLAEAKGAAWPLATEMQSLKEFYRIDLSRWHPQYDLPPKGCFSQNTSQSGSFHHTKALPGKITDR